MRVLNNMTTYWNDLKALEDLTAKITAPIEEPYNDHDIEQFKESVQYFIEDFINNQAIKKNMEIQLLGCPPMNQKNTKKL